MKCAAAVVSFRVQTPKSGKPRKPDVVKHVALAYSGLPKYASCLSQAFPYQRLKNTPHWIRTSNHRFRRRVCYPVAPRTIISFFYFQIHFRPPVDKFPKSTNSSIRLSRWNAYELVVAIFFPSGKKIAESTSFFRMPFEFNEETSSTVRKATGDGVMDWEKWNDIAVSERLPI